MDAAGTAWAGRDNPFGLTIVFVLAISITTLATLILPAPAQGMFAVITGPFNVSIERNALVNILPLAGITAFAELYLKATGREFEILAILLCGTWATYALTTYYIVTTK